MYKEQQEKYKKYEENVDLLMKTCKLLQVENTELQDLNDKLDLRISSQVKEFEDKELDIKRMAQKIKKLENEKKLLEA